MPSALLRLHGEGIRLVLTVDCGISAHEPLAAAQAAGLDVVVLDHHVAEPALPPAVAVVNPNRLDEDSPHTALAAVGVTFLLLVALNRALRERGRFEGQPEPDLIGLLDLVALGTVCDVVPLRGLNRVLVAQGLKVMARRRNIGLRALADVARMASAPGAYHAGFLLGPRVNAGGRVGPGRSRGAAADHGRSGRGPAARRRARQVQHRAERYRKGRARRGAGRRRGAGGRGQPLVLVAGEGWHPGVIGIVASRIVERTNRPACVVALDGAAGKGSCRSIAGVDLGAAVIAARQAGLLVNGGGHRMAAGLTVAADGVERAARLPVRTGRARGRDGRRGAHAGDRRGADAVRGHPRAPGADRPGRAVRRRQPGAALRAQSGARIAKADVVGDNHVRCFLADAQGGRLKAIAFRSLGEPLGDALLKAGGGALNLAGKAARRRLERPRGRPVPDRRRGGGRRIAALTRHFDRSEHSPVISTGAPGACPERSRRGGGAEKSFDCGARSGAL